MVVISRYDRMARLDPAQLDGFIGLFARHDVRLITTSEDPNYPESDQQKFMRNVMASVAAYERDLILSRTRSGLQQRIAQGNIQTGRAPHGYRYLKAQDGLPSRYEVVEELQSEVEQIFRLLAYGDASGRPVSITRLGKLPDEAGIAPPSGLEWAKKSLINLIQNPAYKGEPQAYRWTFKEPKTRRKDASERRTVKWKTSIKKADPATTITLSCPPIVSRELWQAANDALEWNQKHLRRTPLRPYLLGGMVFCANDGRALTGQQKQSIYRCYQCPQCHKSKATRQLENAVWITVAAALLDQEWEGDKRKTKQDDIPARIAHAEAEIIKARRRLEEIEDHWAEGTYSDERRDALSECVVAGIARWQGEISRLKDVQSSNKPRVECLPQPRLNLMVFPQGANYYYLAHTTTETYVPVRHVVSSTDN